MKQEHKDYLEEHIGNFHTVQNGYVRNLDIQLLNMYEHIYRSYLDPNFVLTKWCSSCVMDMLKRLYTHYFNLPQEQVQDLPIVQESVQDPVQEQPKKRGRPKK
jgi:hypothetical protein